MMDDLTDRYGSHNVEQAQIFISQQCDRNGVNLGMDHTSFDQVERILQAMWGDRLIETTNYYWADHG
jgi:hypothetical protein